MKREFPDIGLLVLRVGFCVMMLTHGIPKFQSLFLGPIKFADPIGLGQPLSLSLAIIGEAVAPLLVLIGFKTRWATLPTIITMLVAGFVVHVSDPIGVKEKSILYLIGFVAIFLMGPGKFSIDGFKKQ